MFIFYFFFFQAIGVLWGVFTICFAIIVVVIFIQPQWIGDTYLSKGTGYFGLWQRCTPSETGADVIPCTGNLQDLKSIPSLGFRAATILVGLSVVATLFCVCCLLLFFFVSPVIVFNLAGTIQLLAAIFLLVGICIYPLGFDAQEVLKVCGHTARAYNLGECEIRWAYLLAILGVLDTAGLSALAYVLGSRSRKLKQHIILQQQQPIEPLYGGSIYKGHINPEYVGDITGSRKSLNLQPVLMMPRPDHETYSEYSNPRSKSTVFRPPHYASPTQNFQL
ncbi:Lipoma HMGIC fusion partner-like 4 protein [Armadillidium nasatum]|uniref:Lipoma HMGIC fusion partner-like 4 protein n=1 Tax=Armadillidium nasatum TaxID=96803 RepID=A0A5N5STS9_9CRUS|nr:Lipoma HMGIC fusion partner-like 4 protein [Armadillidium nasatum]